MMMMMMIIISENEKKNFFFDKIFMCHNLNFDFDYYYVHHRLYIDSPHFFFITHTYNRLYSQQSNRTIFFISFDFVIIMNNK